MTDRCMGFLTFKERMFRSLGSLKLVHDKTCPQFVQVMGTFDTKNEIELRRIGTSRLLTRGEDTTHASKGKFLWGFQIEDLRMSDML
jgi:hypothetical protein